MQITEAKAKKRYESGFPLEVQRSKYDLKINERLKSARNRKGLSAAQVIADLKKYKGVSIGHSTLQGYEADENSLNHRYPSLTVLMVLADFYGCSLDYLFGVSDKYKIQHLTTKTIDICDLLESKHQLTYKGDKIKRKQREVISAELDMLLSKSQ